jgi:hypothetical protein
VTSKTDPIERAKTRLEKQYPDAKISTREHCGQPVAMAVEGDLIRLVWLRQPDAERGTATA